MAGAGSERVLREVRNSSQPNLIELSISQHCSTISPYLLKSYPAASAPRGFRHHWSARAGGQSSNDDGFACNRLEVLAQAYHPRDDAVSGADVDQQDVIVVVMDDAVEQSDEFGLALCTESALEYRILQPFAESVHDPENPPPPLRVADIVRDDVQVFVFHD